MNLNFSINKHLEEFKDNLGFYVAWNGTNHVVNSTAEHTGLLISLGTYVPIKNTPALDFESQFFPKNTPFPTIKPSWQNDTTKISHTTGGGRRFYVFPPLRNWLFNDDQKAIDAIITWNLDQLNRPLSHESWKWTWDAYSGILNKGAPDEWTPDKQASNGWNGWDIAHLETSPMFSLAATGHPLGLMNLWMLWRFVVSYIKPGKTFWLNQPRAIAWTLIMAVRAHFAGFGDGDAQALAYCQGLKPQDALNAWVDQLLKADVNGGYSFAGGNTGRTMPILPVKDWNGYGKQIKGEYGWQRGILLWACAYVLKSGILTPANQIAFQEFSDTLYNTQFTRGYNTALGLSYAYGTTDFPTKVLADQLAREGEAQQLKDDPKNPIVLESHEATPGVWLVRHVPRKDDLWLTSAGASVLKGKSDPIAQTSVSINPIPTSNKYNPEYQDPIYAMLEK